jgi:DNA repair protein SbcD/Mre11
MRILHTADWHLGLSLHGISLNTDQRHILEQIVRIAEEERPDAVIIAGDVYDRSAPPPEAVTLLDWAIGRLVLDLGRKVILIAGNHDNGERIGCFSGLLQQRGLHLFGVPRVPLPSVTITDVYGPVRFFVLPYLEPHMARYLLGDESIRTQQQAYEAVVRTIPGVPDGRTVLIGHTFVAGGQSTGSERQLSVGGSEAIAADLFASFTYVALGHLHRPQQLLDGKVRYPGSPLAYSFDEAGQQKSVDIVDIRNDGSCEIRRRPLVPLRAMRRTKGLIVRGTFVLDAGEPVPGAGDFVEVTLRNSEPVADAMSIVQAVYPNTLKLRWERSAVSSEARMATLDEIRRKTPLDLLREFYRTVQRKDMTDAQIALGQRAVEVVEREDML